jgi:hypothetical protein
VARYIPSVPAPGGRVPLWLRSATDACCGHTRKLNS